jgi:hypothetical protein
MIIFCLYHKYNRTHLRRDRQDRTGMSEFCKTTATNEWRCMGTTVRLSSLRLGPLSEVSWPLAPAGSRLPYSSTLNGDYVFLKNVSELQGVTTQKVTLVRISNLKPPQKYCFFSFTFSIVWYTREHDVSETGSVSVLRWRWGRRRLLSWAP